MPTPPRIVVTGDKNTGKSSFITSICGVSIPYSTCSVIEWDLSAGAWAAQVFTSKNGPVTKGYTQNKTLFHDQPTDNDTLQSVVMLALVDLEVDRQVMKDSYRNEATGTIPVSSKYSPYTIHVSLRMPEIPFDMVLVDLPGVLSCGDDVEYVNTIVLSHLKPALSVIILAMPASSYVTSHSAFNLVKQVDPHFCRTISLVTKPDTIEGNASQWIDILEGRMTQPCPSFSTYGRRSMLYSPRKAYLHELEFFDNLDPWSTLANRHVLGANAAIWAAKRISDRFLYDRIRSSHESSQGANYREYMFVFVSCLLSWIVYKFTVSASFF